MDPQSPRPGRFPVARAALLLILVSALIRAAGAAQPGPEPLFLDDATVDGMEAAAPPDALRSRRVRIDWPSLAAGRGDAAAERVALNLFPDVTFVAVRGAIPASAAADG